MQPGSSRFAVSCTRDTSITIMGDEQHTYFNAFSLPSMTISKLHDMSQSSSGLIFKAISPTAYARLPEGLDDASVEDTIYLHDRVHALPERRQRRRRAFQNLYNRYIGPELHWCILLLMSPNHSGISIRFSMGVVTHTVRRRHV